MKTAACQFALTLASLVAGCSDVDSDATRYAHGHRLPVNGPSRLDRPVPTGCVPRGAQRPLGTPRHPINRRVTLFSGGQVVGEWLTHNDTVERQDGRYRFIDSLTGRRVWIDGTLAIESTEPEDHHGPDR